MIKDVTLFHDQDIIHNDMARAAYQSKLNISKAYEQIHIMLLGMNIRLQWSSDNV